jgi:hypothetical protein
MIAIQRGEETFAMQIISLLFISALASIIPLAYLAGSRLRLHEKTE